MIGQTVSNGDIVAERGEELYRSTIRAKVETPDNIGKMVIIDVESGDYSVDENGAVSAHALQAKHPAAELYGIRIGYKTSEALGGVLERTST